MSQTWNYDVDLPGGMNHTIQVQSNSSDADFNLYVLDDAGNTVAEDTGPEPGAEVSLQTDDAGKYVLRIELVKGNCGFSLNVSSSTRGAATPSSPTVAQEWANQLEAKMQMHHRSPNDYGENLFWCAGKSATADEVVDAWGSEDEFYDEAANNWWPKAGHFSQVIWSTTTKVGGGIVRKDGQEIWVCNYSPRGNWTGERPYPVS